MVTLRAPMDGASEASAWQQALLALSAAPDAALALDISLPFCATRCLYCGCDVTAVADPLAADPYVQALAGQIRIAGEQLGRRHDVVRVHFGGGSPNHLEARQIDLLADTVRRAFRTLPETEWLIDCDPRRAANLPLEALRRYGFDHVSLGQADLDPIVQQTVGRVQSMRLMDDVVQRARRAGFASVQVDWVCGLPRQTLQGVQASVQDLLRLGTDRVRCLPFRMNLLDDGERLALVEHHEPDDERGRELWRVATGLLEEAGMVPLGLGLYGLDDDPLQRAADDGQLWQTPAGLLGVPVMHQLRFGGGGAAACAGRGPGTPRLRGGCDRVNFAVSRV